MRKWLVLVAAPTVAAVAVAAAGGRESHEKPVTIRLLQMIDARRGYALGGQSNRNAFRLLWTTDGGHRWHDVTPGASVSSPVTLVGRSTRLVATTLRDGLFAVERSDDGGRTWHRSLPFRDRHGAPAVGRPFAVDSEHLYIAVAEGAAAGSSSEALFTSSDGGDRCRFVTQR